MEVELNYDAAAVNDYTKFALYDQTILHMTVVRWKGEVLQPKPVMKYLCDAGYGLTSFESFHTGDENVLMLKAASRPEALKMEMDSADPGFTLDNVKFTVDALIGTNGIRLRDSITMQKTRPEDKYRLTDTSALDLVLELFRFNDPAREEITKRSQVYVCRILEGMVYKGKAVIFGSYASDMRRQASSDIDISVNIADSPEDESDEYLKHVRPKNELKEATAETLFARPLHKNEFKAYGLGFMICLIAKCLTTIQSLKDHFRFTAIPEARCPLIVLNYTEDLTCSLSLDISFFNQMGIDKANVLELFMQKDQSEHKFMRKCMLYFVLFAKCNRLISGPYPEEKLTPTPGFNSYVMNHLIIHFMQFAIDRKFVRSHADPSKRVDDYNFSDRFDSITHFFRSFFKHLAAIDYSITAIYNSFIMSKTTVAMCHSLKMTPLLVLDPLDPSHNIASRVTLLELKHFNLLIRNALLLMKQKDFQITDLSDTNRKAAEIIKKSRREVVHGNRLEIELPEIIQTSAEFCVLLNEILRFDVSAEHEGTSQENLFNTTGITFIIFGRAWVGRRARRKRLLREELSDSTASTLSVELAVSRSFEFDYNEPVAVLRMKMNEVREYSYQKKASIEVIEGNINEIRDAFHFLLDQFVLNNMTELSKLGIMNLSTLI